MTSRRPEGTERAARGDSAIAVGLGATAALALLMRTVALGQIPGINGDEAWHGMQALDLVRGQAALLTPSGNPLNPFHTLPLVLLHLVFEPAFWILRAPAWLAGVLLPPLAWLLLRKPLGTEVAFVVAFVLCVLPVTIAYSRFGWYPSQSPLAALLLLAAALRNRPVWVFLAFAACLLVHPVNLFLAPLAVAVLGAHLLVPAAERRRIVGRVAAGMAAVVVCAVAGQLLVERTSLLHVAGVLKRVGNPEAWKSFVLGVGRLLSGSTTYAYIAGPAEAFNDPLRDWVFWAVFTPSVIAGGVILVRRRRALEISLVAGTLACLLLGFVVGGKRIVQPSFERYALWMVVPLVSSWAVCTGALLGKRQLRALCLAVGVALLAGFQLSYFQVIRSTGGASHRTFRTAATEPKDQVIERLLAETTPGRVVSLLAQDWWLYWPLRYRTDREPRIEVDRLGDGPPAAELRTHLRAGGHTVVYRDSGFQCASVDPRLAGRISRWTVNDYGERPLIDVCSTRPGDP